MTRFRFYIGTECQETGETRPVPDGAWERVENLLIHHFGGFTRLHGEGAWANNGHVITEPSRIYECLETPGDRDNGGFAQIDFGRKLAGRLRDAAHQSSVLFTAEVVVGEFV